MTFHADHVAFRMARREDDAAVSRLAQLDSARMRPGPVLLAEVDGELRAAHFLESGGTVADPFRPTAGLAALLEMRAAQAAGRRRPSLRGRLANWQRLWARARPGELA
jgi:hypothetical protein